jgi:hypothetical protein
VPDFLVNLGTFIEVKGRFEGRDKTKVKLLEKAGHLVYVVDEPFTRRLANDNRGYRCPKSFNRRAGVSGARGKNRR